MTDDLKAKREQLEDVGDAIARLGLELERLAREGEETANRLVAIARSIGLATEIERLQGVLAEAATMSESQVKAALTACDANGKYVSRGYIDEDDVRAAYEAGVRDLLVRHGLLPGGEPPP